MKEFNLRLPFWWSTFSIVLQEFLCLKLTKCRRFLWTGAWTMWTNRIIGSIMCGLFSIEIFWNCIFLSEFKMMVTIHVAKDERIAENN